MPLWISNAMNFSLNRKTLKYAQSLGYLNSLFFVLNFVQATESKPVQFCARVCFSSLPLSLPHNLILKFLIRFRMHSQAAVRGTSIYANPFCARHLTFSYAGLCEAFSVPLMYANLCFFQNAFQAFIKPWFLLCWNPTSLQFLSQRQAAFESKADFFHWFP